MADLASTSATGQGVQIGQIFTYIWGWWIQLLKAISPTIVNPIAVTAIIGALAVFLYFVYKYVVKMVPVFKDMADDSKELKILSGALSAGTVILMLFYGFIAILESYIIITFLVIFAGAIIILGGGLYATGVGSFGTAMNLANKSNKFFNEVDKEMQTEHREELVSANDRRLLTDLTNMQRKMYTVEKNEVKIVTQLIHVLDNLHNALAMNTPKETLTPTVSNLVANVKRLSSLEVYAINVTSLEKAKLSQLKKDVPTLKSGADAITSEAATLEREMSSLEKSFANIIRNDKDQRVVQQAEADLKYLRETAASRPKETIRFGGILITNLKKYEELTNALYEGTDVSFQRVRRLEAALKKSIEISEALARNVESSKYNEATTEAVQLRKVLVTILDGTNRELKLETADYAERDHMIKVLDEDDSTLQRAADAMRVEHQEVKNRLANISAIRNEEKADVAGEAAEKIEENKIDNDVKKAEKVDSVAALESALREVEAKLAQTNKAGNNVYTNKERDKLHAERSRLKTRINKKKK